MQGDVYPRPQILAVEISSKQQDEEVTIEPPRPLGVKEIDENERLAEPEDHTPPRIWIDENRGAMIRKRLGLVVGVSVILMLLAFWGLSSRKSRSEKELALLQESEAAWEDVTLKEWDQAEASALIAVDAADDLGRSDEASLALRHLHKELQILNQLSSYSPIEIIQDRSQESEDWEVLFRARHGGRWLLLHGEIVRQPTPDETRYWFEYPLDLPTQDVGLVWDTPVEWFDQLSWKDHRVRVFLAVQMKDVRIINEDSNAWEIILSSQEAALWRTPELLAEMFGLDLNSESNQFLSETLDSQRLTSPRNIVATEDTNSSETDHENILQEDQ